MVITDSYPGPRLLAAEWERRGITASAAAAALGLGPASIHHYLRGTYRPNAVTRARIEAWSEGRVPACTWDTAEERAAIEAASGAEVSS